MFIICKQWQTKELTPTTNTLPLLNKLLIESLYSSEKNTFTNLVGKCHMKIFYPSATNFQNFPTC